MKEMKVFESIEEFLKLKQMGLSEFAKNNNLTMQFVRPIFKNEDSVIIETVLSDDTHTLQILFKKKGIWDVITPTETNMEAFKKFLGLYPQINENNNKNRIRNGKQIQQNLKGKDVDL